MQINDVRFFSKFFASLFPAPFYDIHSYFISLHLFPNLRMKFDSYAESIQRKRESTDGTDVRIYIKERRWSRCEDRSDREVCDADEDVCDEKNDEHVLVHAAHDCG